MNEFQISLNLFLGSFEPYANEYFSKKIRSVSKYPPLVTQFYQDLADFTSGGKKLRAFFVYLGYTLKESPLTSKETPLHGILPIALAFELIHSFLLIHDDIIDKSDIRRGKPTIHKRYEKLAGAHYGLSQAILIGDIAFLGAFDLINSSEFTNVQKVACQKEFLKILLGTLYGEALDVEYSYGGVTLPQIWQMIELKTAKYSFVGPLVLGAILGRVDQAKIGALTRFGMLVGTAFQLQDDILGVFGDEKVLGKSVLSDLREGKNTILIYKTKELSGGKDKADLEGIWGKREATEKDLRRVQEIIYDSKALEWCQNESLRLVNEAKEQVGKIVKDARMQDIFCQMADFAIRRDK